MTPPSSRSVVRFRLRRNGFGITGPAIAGPIVEEPAERVDVEAIGRGRP